MAGRSAEPNESGSLATRASTAPVTSANGSASTGVSACRRRARLPSGERVGAPGATRLHHARRSHPAGDIGRPVWFGPGAARAAVPTGHLAGDGVRGRHGTRGIALHICRADAEEARWGGGPAQAEPDFLQWVGAVAWLGGCTPRLRVPADMKGSGWYGERLRAAGECWLAARGQAALVAAGAVLVRDSYTRRRLPAGAAGVLSRRCCSSVAAAAST